MILVRRLARPLLASVFITTGLDHFRHPGDKIEGARPLVKAASKVTGKQANTERAVRVNGALMTGAGVLFAMGKMPRLSAAMLAASLIPTTVAEHAFWKETDPETKREERRRFLNNAALLGGLLIAAGDTEGKPGLLWRSQHAKLAASQAADRKRQHAVDTVHQVRKDASREAELLKLKAQQRVA